MWAIVTTHHPDTHRHSFNVPDPLALNCSLYANFMMAVWARGGTSTARHTGRKSAVRGDHHLAVECYRYQRLVKCETLAAIRTAARRADRLYCLEPGDLVWHMVLLLGSDRLAVQQDVSGRKLCRRDVAGPMVARPRVHDPGCPGPVPSNEEPGTAKGGHGTGKPPNECRRPASVSAWRRHDLKSNARVDGRVPGTGPSSAAGAASHSNFVGRVCVRP